MQYKTFLLLLFFTTSIQAQINVTEVATLPIKVSNNAVCEGFIKNTPYVFSFAGIDSTKLYSGIHLKSYRYNTKTKKAIRIPDVPDRRGKIACAASRIDSIIYISGGYYVFKNHSEVSSNKMHRYDIIHNVFLKDGKNIPIATDDHVQAIWQNKLLYLITGWSNKTNIPNVQIYDPKLDIWLTGTAIPNQSSYKSFGASGTIIGNTIYYFGGATSDKGFAIQNQLRIGKINSENPTEIDWSISTPSKQINGYRMACITIKNKIHWIGGSNNTYNYNGIAYDKTGGVSPNNRDLYTCSDKINFKTTFINELPMDLRGIAKTNRKVAFLVGGMLANQTISNKIWKLTW